jgi:dihydrofolate synthase/folylpolyglutamate synthase
MNSGKFTSSSEIFSWLSQFINLESGQTPKSFRIDRMEALVEFAGQPERCAPSIHIAGSKGKGSITGMMASCLEADGRRVARYMSPHVSDIRERISLGSSFFDEAAYCAAGDELREIAEQKAPSVNLFDPANEEGEAPTYFELLTLYFFLCARYVHCDAMVVETGMGGRLDSTNVVDPLVSVISLIELEHTKFLGHSIEAVAGEKAGIIKEGRPLVLAKQCGEALGVFKKKATEKHSPLIYFPDIAELSNIRVHTGGTDFTLTFRADAGTGSALFPAPLDLSVPIPGLVQAGNAGLAVAALKIAFPSIGEGAIHRGLENFRIPARFEKIADDPPLIIDGAHTPESAALCADTFRSLYGEDGLLLFGCAADKNAQAMAEILRPLFSEIIITTPGTFKISDPERVYQAFTSGSQQPCGAEKEKIVFVKDTMQAIKQALELARRKKLPALCTGSFYLASELRNFVLACN